MAPHTRTARIVILPLLCLAIHQHVPAQGGEHTLVTSSGRHVSLEKGTSMTLKAVAVPAPLAADTASVPEGQFVQAVVAEKVAGKSARVGDDVRLHVLYPFQFETKGRTVRVPRNAVIHGHVTHVAERGGKNTRAQLAFATDRLAWAEETFLLSAVAVAIQPVESSLSGRNGSSQASAGADYGGICHTCSSPTHTLDRR